jgi:deoxyribose-phosphate aldolase
MDTDWPGHPPDYSKPPRGELTVAQVAAMIDHSLLRPELTLNDVTLGCEIAAAHEVASVCCKPADVVHASRVLAGTPVLVGTVVGFPHGSSTTETKVFEARGALQDGARELDMVINIGWLRGGEHAYVAADIRAIVEVAATTGALVKVIFENAYLTEDEKVRACHLTEEAGADFVKTSTGFAATGATMDDLVLMRRSVGPAMQVKAAGGVRTLDTLLAMVAIGVSRFGATVTVALLADAKERAARGELRVPTVAASSADAITVDAQQY